MDWVNLSFPQAMTTQQQVLNVTKCVRIEPSLGGRKGKGDSVRSKGLRFSQGVWSSGGKELQRILISGNESIWRTCNFKWPLKSATSSLGFTADPRVGIERAANGLLKDAAMLLLYQDVFRTPPAQAFLKVLLALRRGDDGLKLLESYGEFFKLMAIGRYASWEDYILDGILSGEKNPFTEAAANVGNPRSTWSGGVPPNLRAAAAADLDSLQRLSITESTLSGWVAEMVSDVKPEWRAAAASNVSSRTVAKSTAFLETGTRQTFGFGLLEPKSEELDSKRDRPELEIRNNLAADKSEVIIPEAPGLYTQSVRTFVHDDREKWRKKIGGLWRWSEAVPLLEQYYVEHSVGRVASTQFLQWKGGKITADSKWVTKASSVCDLSVHKENKEALRKNLIRHTQRNPSHHVLLFGPTGIGKTWLVRSVLSEVTSSKDLHILTLPVADLKSIYTVVEELARHWQLRFALLIDDLFSTGGEDQYTYLKSALDGNVQEWPDNVILCATSSRKMVKDGATGVFDSGQLFGLTLKLEEMEEDKFITCVSELAEQRKPALSLETVLSSEVMITQAKLWAEKLGAWNVRSAAQFVKAHLRHPSLG